MNHFTVLVIDDDERILRFVKSSLKLAKYKHFFAMNGRDGLNLARTVEPDLIVLDIGLPVLDGWEVLRELRTFSKVPVIILSAKGEDMDKIRGLNLGADDYLAKPFHPDELMARIEAVMRRAKGGNIKVGSGIYQYGDLRIDLGRHKITFKNIERSLTRQEGLLLGHFTSNAGRLLTNREILQKVWGPGYQDDAQLLRTAINRIRNKLSDIHEADDLITNVPRVGYIFKRKP